MSKTGEELMADITETLGYFKKLQRVVSYESDFAFAGYSLIKKSKIDDVLCCILATFPESYKAIMKQREGNALKSVVAYNMLFNAVKGKFVFNPNVYLVKHKDAVKYIATILVCLEKDIIYVEKNFRR